MARLEVEIPDVKSEDRAETSLGVIFQLIMSSLSLLVTKSAIPQSPENRSGSVIAP